MYLKAVMSEVGGDKNSWVTHTISSFSIRTERDVSAWSSERLRQLLLGVRVEGPEGACHLTDVSKLDGEASINNRKGKLFFFYEWQLRANWLGQWCHWWCHPCICLPIHQSIYLSTQWTASSSSSCGSLSTSEVMFLSRDLVSGSGVSRSLVSHITRQSGGSVFPHQVFHDPRLGLQYSQNSVFNVHSTLSLHRDQERLRHQSLSSSVVLTVSYLQVRPPVEWNTEELLMWPTCPTRTTKTTWMWVWITHRSTVSTIRLTNMFFSRFRYRCVKISPAHLSWTSWRGPGLKRSVEFWASMSMSLNQVCYPQCIRTSQSKKRRMSPVVTVTSDLTEFSQGMIFPTADGQKSSTPAPPKKNQVKTSKTQVKSTCVPDTTAVNAELTSFYLCVLL